MSEENNSALGTGAQDSVVYPGGLTRQNTALHRGTNNVIASLSQLVGRSLDDSQPEVIDSFKGAVATIKGLYAVPGSHFIYYVRDADITLPEYTSGSQGKVKKIVTFPSTVEETTIIRATVFAYQNPTFPTKVTSIRDYEEEASFYMNAGNLFYDANSVAQNNINPN